MTSVNLVNPKPQDWIEYTVLRLKTVREWAMESAVENKWSLANRAIKARSGQIGAF